MGPESLPLDRLCKVIKHHPEGLWAIEKASGVMSHPNFKNYKGRCLLNCTFDFKDECYRWKNESGVNGELFLTHRIDSATSGVLIASSCPELAEKLKKAFADRIVEKTYFAIVHYNGKPVRSIWKDTLEKIKFAGKMRVCVGRNGSTAITQSFLERKIITKQGELALLRLIPLTGRTHQLRVQCASRRLPIVGDRTYGNFELNRRCAKELNSDRLFLHASKVKVQITLRNRSKINWEVESPLPQIFEKLLG